jgi:transposase
MRNTDTDFVCWSDESHFYTNGRDGGGIYITRRPGEEYDIDNLQTTYYSGQVSVAVWGCFMNGEKGPLVVLPKGKTITSEIYLHEVFLPYFLPFYLKMREKYGPQVRMQEDNASYHSSKLLKGIKDLGSVEQIWWPPQSPDLSPIENIWREMKLRISRVRHRYGTYESLKAAIQKAWDELPTEVFKKYARTMPKRMKLLQKSRGGPIKY